MDCTDSTILKVDSDGIEWRDFILTWDFKTRKGKSVPSLSSMALCNVGRQVEIAFCERRGIESPFSRRDKESIFVGKLGRGIGSEHSFPGYRSI